jgi:hypothetical protein
MKMALICLMVLASKCWGDETNWFRIQPKGHVMIYANQVMGRLSAELSASITVSAVEYRDATSGNSAVGVMLSVVSGTDLPSGFIDRTEIDQLMAGMDAIQKLNASSSKLGAVSATYTSKFGIEITRSLESGDFPQFADSITVNEKSVMLGIGNMAKLRALLVKAKAVLDSKFPIKKEP